MINKFKQCVQYYLNGTEGGFLKYRPRFKSKNNINLYDFMIWMHDGNVSSEADQW